MLALPAFLLSVLVISLSGALMPGPLLAVVVKNAPRNRWAGAEAVLGHALIEIPLVILIAVGFSHLFASTAARLIVGGAGGVALIWLGVDSLRARISSPEELRGQRAPRSIGGGLIASLNPYFFLWWATAGAALILEAMRFSFGMVILYGVHLLVDLAWYAIVAYAAAHAMRLGTGWQRWLLRLCGIAMIGFGGYFLWGALQSFLKMIVAR